MDVALQDGGGQYIGIMQCGDFVVGDVIEGLYFVEVWLVWEGYYVYFYVIVQDVGSVIGIWLCGYVG